jgi:hypothetical protein
MDEARLKQDRAIDPHQLDVECVRQADIFYNWASLAIDAKFKADEIEEAADTLEAKLQLAVRTNPEDFNIKNVTETAVKCVVATQPELITARTAGRKARHEQMLLDRAVAALEQKKRMLEVLITLHGQQYFAGPSVPRDLIAAWEEHQHRQEEACGERQRKAARKRVQYSGD